MVGNVKLPRPLDKSVADGSQNCPTLTGSGTREPDEVSEHVTKMQNARFAKTRLRPQSPHPTYSLTPQTVVISLCGDNLCSSHIVLSLSIGTHLS